MYVVGVLSHTFEIKVELSHGMVHRVASLSFLLRSGFRWGIELLDHCEEKRLRKLWVHLYRSAHLYPCRGSRAFTKDLASMCKVGKDRVRSKLTLHNRSVPGDSDFVALYILYRPTNNKQLSKNVKVILGGTLRNCGQENTLSGERCTKYFRVS